MEYLQKQSTLQPATEKKKEPQSVKKGMSRNTPLKQSSASQNTYQPSINRKSLNMHIRNVSPQVVQKILAFNKDHQATLFDSNGGKSLNRKNSNSSFHASNAYNVQGSHSRQSSQSKNVGVVKSDSVERNEKIQQAYLQMRQ